MNFAGCRKAFTLIEIVVAITIFAIIMTSLYASFRIGMKTYTMGTTHAEEQQAGRYAMNQIASDMRNIFYKPESQYNVTRRQREALQDQQDEQLRQAGSTGAADASGLGSSSSGGSRASRGGSRGSSSGLGASDGDVSTGDDQVDENLPEMGPPIDLSFKGEDGGDTDQLTMVRRESDLEGREHIMWGLERVTYYVKNKNLYRSVDDITQPETDEDGNEIPKPNPPRVDKLASNCVGFDLKYGYYYDGDYQLADSWDSNASQYRNPPEDEDETDSQISDPNSGKMSDVSGTAASAAFSQQIQSQQQEQTEDDLPGWVELTFKFAPDPKHEEHQRTYKLTMLLYNKYSMETYVPPDDDDTQMGSSDYQQRQRDRASDRDSDRGSRRDRGGRSSRGSRSSGNSATGSGNSGMGSGEN